MSVSLILIAAVVTGAVVIEVACRAYYRHRFLVPFRSKRIGEYPFGGFIEQVEPPLHFGFKKGFRSPMVTINRFGLRGPEPAVDGEKRRVLVIGESGYFGAKLLHERDLWSSVMAAFLRRDGRADWEILNAGMPGYNAFQYRAWWELELCNTKPDIVILQMGGNDISQAFMMGSRWSPGVPWPWEFMLRQQRQSSLFNKMLVGFCAYFLWRRRKLTERRGFDAGDAEFSLERCEEAVIENAGAIIADARQRGIRVCLANTPIAYDPDMTADNRRRADSIQGNWEESLKTTGLPVISFMQRWVGPVAADMDCPGIDTLIPFWRHPRRFEMFLDMVHANADGHRLTAEVLYEGIDTLGWWERGA